MLSKDLEFFSSLCTLILSNNTLRIRIYECKKEQYRGGVNYLHIQTGYKIIIEDLDTFYTHLYCLGLMFDEWNLEKHF